MRREAVRDRHDRCHHSLRCEDGKELWRKPGSDLVPMFTTHAFSPVVDRGLVIFHPGGHDKGAITAFDVNTGATKWSWDGDGPGYGSPIVVDLGGTRQLIALTQAKLVGLDVATGACCGSGPSSAAISPTRPRRSGRPDRDRLERRTGDRGDRHQARRQMDHRGRLDECRSTLSPQ